MKINILVVGFGREATKIKADITKVMSDLGIKDSDYGTFSVFERESACGTNQGGREIHSPYLVVRHNDQYDGKRIADYLNTKLCLDVELEILSFFPVD